MWGASRAVTCMHDPRRAIEFCRRVCSRHEHEDCYRRQDDRVLQRLFKAAVPGENVLSEREFVVILNFAFPREVEELRDHRRRAALTGKIEWSAGVHFALRLDEKPELPKAA